jgi:hypothetical protein
VKDLPRILAIIVGVAVVGYFVLGKLSKEGILGLLGYETMKSVHTFITKSPDGRIRSQFRESMDGNDAVRVEIERLNAHFKMSNRMSISEWKEFYDSVKDYIEPGTDKVECYSHQGKEMEEPFKE